MPTAIALSKKRLRSSFLVALYNLRLPEGQLSPEDKKRLSYVVWLFFEFPPMNLYDPPSDGDNRPPGFLYFNGFSIRREMMGYMEPDEKGFNRSGEEAWWKSEDFDAFQRNYQHLCGCIESCIEGENDWNFRRNDLEWLHEKSSRLVHFSVQLSWKRPVFMVVSETPPGAMRPARPEETPPDVRPPLLPLSLTGESSTGSPPAGYVWAFLDLLRTGGAWLYKQSEDGTISFDQFSPVIVPEIECDMPPSDLILHRAYLELIGIINHHGTFRRCKAEATPRRPACQKIFPHPKQRGKRREWCSDTCKKRIHEAKQRKQRKAEAEALKHRR